MSTSTSEETLCSNSSSSISLNHLMNFSRHNLETDNIEFDYRIADTLSATILHLWSSKNDCDLIFLVFQRRYYAHSFLLFNICRSLSSHVINIKSATVKYICQLKVTPYHGLELLLIYVYTSRLILNEKSLSS